MTTPSISDLSALREVAEHPGAQYLAEQTVADVLEALEHEPVSSFPDFTAAIRSIVASLTAEKARADAAEAERDEANTFLDRERGFVSHQAETIARLTEQLAGAREALKPFADAAESYDPPEGDDSHMAWAHDFPIGALRRARATLSRLEKQEGGACGKYSSATEDKP